MGVVINCKGMFKISSLKCYSNCAPTKCSGNLFHSLVVVGKNECKYELTLADGTVNLCMWPLVMVDNGVKNEDGITASALVILYIITNVK